MKEGIEVDNPWVCLDCGKAYMEEYNLPLQEGVSTAHIGRCCNCHKEKMVIDERNYRYLHNWKKEEYRNAFGEGEGY